MCWHGVAERHSTCWLLVRKDSGLAGPVTDQHHHTGTIRDYDIVLKGSEWIRSAVRQGALRIEPAYWSPSRTGQVNFVDDFGPSATCGLVVLPPDDVCWQLWETTRPRDITDWVVVKNKILRGEAE